jgi:hypothetical protein
MTKSFRRSRGGEFIRLWKMHQALQRPLEPFEIVVIHGAFKHQRMGTWNAKPFGNDTATDWIYELAKSTGTSAIEKALEAGLRDLKPEVGACERALGAAAIVEAARRTPIGRLPAAARDWILETGFVSSNQLIELAIQVVSKIRNESELLDLWKEALPGKWFKELDQLEQSLRTLQNTPAPARMPKPPNARMGLPKLIEKAGAMKRAPCAWHFEENWRRYRTSMRR